MLCGPHPSPYANPRGSVASYSLASQANRGFRSAVFDRRVVGVTRRTRLTPPRTLAPDDRTGWALSGTVRSRTDPAIAQEFSRNRRRIGRRGLAAQVPGDPSDGARGFDLEIDTDGAARPTNPGPAGIGVVIRNHEGQPVREIAEGIGRASSNTSEYMAAIRALEVAREMGARRVRLRTDSKLVVEQARGNWRVKEPTLKPLHARLVGLAAELDHVRFEHIPRAQNAAADRLAAHGAERDDTEFEA